ncbi:MAG: sialidase family protein [Acidimicrobiales bacterium]
MLAASVAGLLGAAPGAALAASTTGIGQPAIFTRQGVAIKRVTAAVQMTKSDPVPYRAFTGPSKMLVDPANPRIIVAATAEMRTRVCYLMRSTDAGRTWQILPAVPALGSYPFCTGPAAGVPLENIAWGRNSTLYYAMDGYDNADGGASRSANYSVLLAKSTNLGNSWTTTLVDNNRGKTGTAITNDGPVTGLAVDTSGPQDVVYLGFSRSFPHAPKGSAAAGNHVMVVVSTNGGTTFAPAVNIDKFSHVTETVGGKSYPLVMSGFGTPYLAVHNGVVVAVGGATGALGVTLPTKPLGKPILVARSTDQGRTWSISKLTAPVVTPTGAQTGMGWTPIGGPQGTFLITYAATPNEQTYAAPVVDFQRSTDGGRTWTSPVILDDNYSKSQLYTSFFPQLNVAPNGRVDVIWWDNRRSHGYAYDIYYSYSTTGGATWSRNVRVTDRPSNFGLGISYNSDVRQPPGVASANQYAAFGWTDTRLATVQTQTQDDFGDVAQFAPIPASGSSLLPILASVFGGLLAAGLVLIVFMMVRRRKEGPTPPKVEVREPVGAE